MSTTIQVFSCAIKRAWLAKVFDEVVQISLPACTNPEERVCRDHFLPLSETWGTKLICISGLVV
jgi:hypothetical protein